MRDDTRWMRGVALVLGVCVAGCGGAAASSPPGADSGEAPHDAIADVDGGSLDRAADRVTAGWADAADARADGNPFFDVTLDASIPPGTEVRLSARAYGWGHPAPDCNGFVLSFSLGTT